MPAVVSAAASAALAAIHSSAWSPAFCGSACGSGWFEPGSLSFEVVKTLLGALIPSVVAVAAGLMAFWQYRVARARFRLELFEQRLEVFKEVKDYLVQSLRYPPALGVPDA